MVSLSEDNQSAFNSAGCLKTWTCFENAITPSFMGENFFKFSVVVAN